MGLMIGVLCMIISVSVHMYSSTKLYKIINNALIYNILIYKNKCNCVSCNNYIVHLYVI